MSENHARDDIDSERTFFDAYYGENLAKGLYRPEPSPWDDRALQPRSRPLDYWEYAFYVLGDLRDQRVLDLGCGGGWITQLLAAKGAKIAACDVSLEGCRLTQTKLRAHGHAPGAIAVMDGHFLGFPDQSFDAVFFSGVLHHMNIPVVAREIHRVLRPEGRLVGYEPLRYGRIMWALRQAWLRLRGLKEYPHSDHEEELKLADLAPLADVFRRVTLRRFNFIGKVGRLKHRWGLAATALKWIDYVVLAALPFTRRFCTTVLIHAVK